MDSELQRFGYVLDANIPISICKINKLKDIFYNFMNEYGIVYMSEINYNEINDRRLKEEMKNALNHFEIIDTDKKIFEDVYSYFKENYAGKMAQKNDYYLLATAIQKDADFIITNDWKISNHILDYTKLKKLKIYPMTMPLFLKYVYKIDKKIMNIHRYIQTNLKFYKDIEIENMVRKWEENHRDMEKRINLNKRRFEPYMRNVVEASASYVTR